MGRKRRMDVYKAKEILKGRAVGKTVPMPVRGSMYRAGEEVADALMRQNRQAQREVVEQMSGGTLSIATGEAEKAQGARKGTEQYVTTRSARSPLEGHSIALEMLHRIKAAVKLGQSLGIPDWVAEVYPGITREPLRIPSGTMDSMKPYYVTGQVMDALHGPLLAGNVPDWYMGEDGVPTPSGMVWFERPPLAVLHPDAKDGRGYRWDMVALSWVSAYGHSDGERLANGTMNLGYRSKRGEGDSPILDVIGWWRDSYAPASYLPAPVSQIMYSGPGTDLYERSMGEIDPAIKLNIGWWKVRGPMDLAERVAAVFEVLQTFISQTLFVTTERSADRQTRRRLDRMAVHPLIHVIEIRKTQRTYTGDLDPDREKREFSCQWPVEGHWHRYWIGPRNAERKSIRKWVAGYIKGPSDMPFVGQLEKLYKVAR